MCLRQSKELSDIILLCINLQSNFEIVIFEGYSQVFLSY